MEIIENIDSLLILLKKSIYIPMLQLQSLEARPTMS